MAVIADVAYAPEHGRFGLLDLVLPSDREGSPVVIIYHGGGLRALRKERMTHVAEFIARCGYVAVNANYRLLPDAEFPAPVEDALRVVEWVQARSHERLASADASRLAVLGASAGGYLALMVGLRLGCERVRAMVSISGPSTRVRAAAMTNAQDTSLFAAPLDLVTANAPPLLAVHSRNDELVLPSESHAIVNRIRAVGKRAELYEFDGPGRQHGIWRDDRDPPYLFEHIEARLKRFLGAVLDLSQVGTAPQTETDCRT